MSKKPPSGTELENLKYKAYQEWKKEGDGTYEIDGRKVTIENQDTTTAISDPKVTKVDGENV